MAVVGWLLVRVLSIVIRGWFLIMLAVGCGFFVVVVCWLMIISGWLLVGGALALAGIVVGWLLVLGNRCWLNVGSCMVDRRWWFFSVDCWSLVAVVALSFLRSVILTLSTVGWLVLILCLAL